MTMFSEIFRFELRQQLRSPLFWMIAFAFDGLTARELEILRLAAAGKDNGEIADSLVLSVRTVERHLSNAYLKLGVSGRAGRAAAVADLVRRGLA